MFSVYNDRGFQVKLENGYTVSVQFSEFHYCHKPNRIKNYVTISENAELAIKDSDNMFVTNTFVTEYLNKEHGDDVLGYITSEVYLDALNWARNQKAI